MRQVIFVVVLLAGIAACGDDGEPTPPATASSPPMAGGQAWPPSGPGCAELAACCASLSSDAQLFCRLSVASPPVDCVSALGSVRSYLGERGAAMPPTCGQGAAAGAAAEGPPWVELTLPDVEGWERRPGEDEGPERGYIVEYGIEGQLGATVYVYRGGVANISRDEAILRGEAERTLGGIQRAVEAGAYQGVRPAGDLEITTLGPGGPVAAHQRVVIQTEGGPQLSEIYVTTHRGFFFKLRVTIYAEPTPAIAHQLNQLYAALGSAAVAQ